MNHASQSRAQSNVGLYQVPSDATLSRMRQLEQQAKRKWNCRLVLSFSFFFFSFVSVKHIRHASATIVNVLLHLQIQQEKLARQELAQQQKDQATTIASSASGS